MMPTCTNKNHVLHWIYLVKKKRQNTDFFSSQEIALGSIDSYFYLFILNASVFKNVNRPGSLCVHVPLCLSYSSFKEALTTTPCNRSEETKKKNVLLKRGKEISVTDSRSQDVFS